MQMNELKQRMAQAGVVGAGGAGFPSAVKLAEGADTLIIDAAECEPLLYTDFTILRMQLQRVLSGAETVIEAAGIRRGVLALREDNARALGLSHGQKLSAHVTVHELPNVYPVGDEVILVYEVMRRVIDPGALPITVGAIVYNAETLYNIDRAVKENAAVTEKWLTIGGQVREPMVVRVPIGMRVRELFEKLGVTVPEDSVVVDGGPAMGNVIDPNQAVVKKTTKALTIYPRTIPAMVSKLNENRVVNVHAASNCCQCTRCTDLCPRALIGYPLEPHKIIRTSMSMVEEMPELFTGATTCSNCGVCELTACCQNISPRRVYAQIKGVLAKNKLRFTGKAGEVDPDREYRMVPHERFARMIGVAPYDQIAQWRDTALKPSEIRLLTRQHVGAPAKAVVQVGDVVEAGALVAAADGAISANIHAPVRARVAAVSASTVVLVPQ